MELGRLSPPCAPLLYALFFLRIERFALKIKRALDGFPGFLRRNKYGVGLDCLLRPAAICGTRLHALGMARAIIWERPDMTTLDRSEINRALAKAIAYKQCGKDHAAETWAAELVRLLDCAGILSDIAIHHVAVQS